MQSEMMKWMLKQRAGLPGFQDHIRSTAKGSKMTDEQIEEAKRLIESGKYDIRTNNAEHLNIISGEINGFRNLPLAKTWRIILSEGPYHFITSDNPVAECIPPRTGIFGPTLTDRKHYLAVTPRLLIETGRPAVRNPEQQPVDRLSYHTASDKQILTLNLVLATHAHQFVYAPRTDEFEQLLKAI